MKIPVEDLLHRIAALEQRRNGTSLLLASGSSAIAMDESIRRARRSVEEREIYSAIWRFVPDNYYRLPLEQRAVCLGADSIQYLCKSLLMENRKAASSDDPTNPRFLLIIIQYAALLDVKKLTNSIRGLRSDVQNRLDESQFDFRIASEEDNRSMTGFEHNSVTPFGLLKSVPIIVSSDLLPLKFFWMGGGHVHLKLRVSLEEFCKSFNPILADVSRPRTIAELHDANSDI